MYYLKRKQSIVVKFLDFNSIRFPMTLKIWRSFLDYRMTERVVWSPVILRLWFTYTRFILQWGMCSIISAHFTCSCGDLIDMYNRAVKFQVLTFR